jgi:ubiquinone biosynthesis accessory factor UbiJ
MFKTLAAEFLQHITHQNNWSRKHLISSAGKVLQFNIALIRTNLLILEDGSLGVAPNHAVADVTIHIPPSLALRLIAKDEAAKMLIKIEGDTQLATEVGKVLQQLRWDIEDDLSNIIGDIPANKIASITKKALATTKEQSINLAEMMAEYWQEEKLILAKKWQVEKFNADVETLRSDCARLEKRLEKLTINSQESHTA